MICLDSFVAENETDLVVIQPSSFCNIDCDYCYVTHRNTRSIMSDSVLEDIIRKIFSYEGMKDGFRLVWHNGEPMALGMEFYEKVIYFIKKYNVNQKLFKHRIQTNGILINQAWIDFFIKHDIYPSVSIDGPSFVHNIHRKNRQGKGTFDQVMRGISLLRKNNIKLSGLVVITADSLFYPKEILEFFVKEGFSSIGLIVEEPHGGNQNTSFVNATAMGVENVFDTAYKNFIAEFFDAWIPFREQLAVREFSDMLHAFHGMKFFKEGFLKSEDSRGMSILSFNQAGGISTFSPQMIAGIDNNQDIFNICNIADIKSLGELQDKSEYKRLLQSINKGIAMCAEQCDYFRLCGGGTPAGKYYEKGTFECTETRKCRYAKKHMADVLLEKLAETSEFALA